MSSTNQPETNRTLFQKLLDGLELEKSVGTKRAVANQLGLGRNTYYRGRYIIDVADGQRDQPAEVVSFAKDLLSKLKDGEIGINTSYLLIKKKIRREAVAPPTRAVMSAFRQELALKETLPVLEGAFYGLVEMGEISSDMPLKVRQAYAARVAKIRRHAHTLVNRLSKLP